MPEKYISPQTVLNKRYIELGQWPALLHLEGRMKPAMYSGRPENYEIKCTPENDGK